MSDGRMIATAGGAFQRPLPDTRAELLHLKWRIEKIMPVWSREVADALARRLLNEKMRTIMNDQPRVMQLAEEPLLSDSERVQIKSYLARQAEHQREADEVCCSSSPLKIAERATTLDAYGTGIGLYFSAEEQSAIVDLRARHHEAIASDAAVRQSHPPCHCDLEVLCSFDSTVVSWWNYLRALLAASVSLVNATVRKLGVLEGRTKSNFEIELDANRISMFPQGHSRAFFGRRDSRSNLDALRRRH